MREAYLPDWFRGQTVPPTWWPGRPRTFYGYTLTMLAPPVFFTRGVTFSKRTDALVFGGVAAVWNSTDTLNIEPSTGSGPNELIRLSNPAGNEVFTSDFVPIESLFTCAADGKGPSRVEGMAQAAGLPALWPVPIAVRRGGELQVSMIHLNTASVPNVRITFWVALISPLRRNAREEAA